MAGVRRRLAGLVRLTHPFPSLLDGLATVAFALLAGADGGVAARLGAAMVALQASIGALNDLVDAPRDEGRKLGKPIPAGVVSPRLARGVVLVGAGAGLALSVPSGIIPVALAALVLGIGYAYSIRFKGTPWSWLPFAVGIPLLPVYAWWGAAGVLPVELAVLVPCAALAGAALAIMNALADLERDAAAGITSVAHRLGARAAWILHATLLAIVLAAAFLTLIAAGARPQGVVVAAVGALLVVAGIALGRGRGPVARERAWELEAVGVAVLGTGWIAALLLGE